MVQGTVLPKYSGTHRRPLSEYNNPRLPKALVAKKRNVAAKSKTAFINDDTHAKRNSALFQQRVLDPMSIRSSGDYEMD